MSEPKSVPSERGRPGNPRSWPFCVTGAPTPGPTWPGTSRIQYPPNVRVIRVPCSGRVNPIFIVEALRQGADGVLVSGCHPGDCHYLAGNYFRAAAVRPVAALPGVPGHREGARAVLLGVGLGRGAFCRGRDQGDRGCQEAGPLAASEHQCRGSRLLQSEREAI